MALVLRDALLQEEGRGCSAGERKGEVSGGRAGLGIERVVSSAKAARNNWSISASSLLEINSSTLSSSRSSIFMIFNAFPLVYDLKLCVMVTLCTCICFRARGTV